MSIRNRNIRGLYTLNCSVRSRTGVMLAILYPQTHSHAQHFDKIYVLSPAQSQI